MQQLPTPSNSSCSPSSSPAQPGRPTTPSLTTPSDLESFCWQFLHCMNTRDFNPTHLLPHFSPSFTASAPGQIPCNSVSELLSNRQALVEKYPELELVFLSANSEVREGSDFAEVFVFTEIRGMPVGVRRQVLNVFRWRRTREEGFGGGIEAGLGEKKWKVVEFTFLARQPVEEGRG